MMPFPAAGEWCCLRVNSEYPTDCDRLVTDIWFDSINPYASESPSRENRPLSVKHGMLTKTA